MSTTRNAFWLASLLLVTATCAVGAQVSQEGKSDLEAVLATMASDGHRFDPQPVVDRGVDGMRAMLNHCFPETAPAGKQRRQEVQRLINQLGDDSFDRREEATQQLCRIGHPHQDLLRNALDSDDAEIRFRVTEILKLLQQRNADNAELAQKTCAALETYLKVVDDLACQQELARRVATCLEARLDKSDRAQALNVCLAAMTNWKIDLVHEELLPLLEQDDPAAAIFAMHGIGGRTGNSYVAPIHMGAISSGRRELVKAGLRCMPCPIWDRKNKPLVREAYIKIFDAQELEWDFSDDDPFMQTSAFVAARDFGIVKARDWLLQRMASSDKSVAKRAIQSLGDTYYMRRPIYPELLAALRPHLNSEDAELRAAAISTVGVYQGDPVPTLLLTALADPNQRVWQTAGGRLADQHGYHRRGESPTPMLLTDAMAVSEDETTFKARARFLLKHVQQERPGYLQWPETLD